MSISSELFHYSTIALAVGINSIGVGIGEGLTGLTALEAINIQPSAKSDITKIAILGMALIETAAIMGGSIAIILLFSKKSITAQFSGLAELGIILAICLPGFCIGIASSMPARQSCLAVARQPFLGKKILRFMLIVQSIIQTPIVFGFIIAMFIKSEAQSAFTLPEALRLIGSGLCIGLGSVGPAIGMAIFAKTACESIGINRNAYDKLLSFTFISEAIIETPIVFSLVISILLAISTTTSSSEPLLAGIAMLSASLCTGLGTIGPGISSVLSVAT